MAKVILKDIKKIYPHSGSSRKRSLFKRKKNEPEKKSNLQITDQGVVAVQSFNLEIEDNEFIVLVGPSGCGKSTTLRMIAGLEEITEGELYIDGELMNKVEPKDRDIAMVFQSYALYPHLTIRQNIAFPLTIEKVPKDEINQRVEQAAEILGITDLLERRPKALSGGQRQRVAIGRAIVREPKILLMDEPLSNLDAKLRTQMRAEIIKLHRRIDTTFVYVTHDQVEAMTLGDRIVIMKDGFVQQVGTPQEVFNRPRNIFVAGFIGTPQMNFFDAKIILEHKQYYLEFNKQKIALTDELNEKLAKTSVDTMDIILGIRPNHIQIGASDDDQVVEFEGKIEVAEMMGTEMHLHILVEDEEKTVVVQIADVSEEQLAQLKEDNILKFGFDLSHSHFFDAETELRIQK